MYFFLDICGEVVHNKGVLRKEAFDMATDKPRFTITLSEDLYEKVNEYQHDMRFSTQTKAIVDLIERGAKSLGLVMDYESFSLDPNIKAPTISDEAKKVAKDYDGLDHHGKRVVRLVLDEEQRRMAEEQHPLEIAARTGVRLKRSDDLDSIPLIGEDSEVP